jgi:hypothetical protein
VKQLQGTTRSSIHVGLETHDTTVFCRRTVLELAHARYAPQSGEIGLAHLSSRQTPDRHGGKVLVRLGGEHTAPSSPRTTQVDVDV